MAQNSEEAKHFCCAVRNELYIVRIKVISRLHLKSLEK